MGPGPVGLFYQGQDVGFCSESCGELGSCGAYRMREEVTDWEPLQEEPVSYLLLQVLSSQPSCFLPFSLPRSSWL